MAFCIFLHPQETSSASKLLPGGFQHGNAAEGHDRLPVLGTFFWRSSFVDTLNLLCYLERTPIKPDGCSGKSCIQFELQAKPVWASGVMGTVIGNLRPYQNGNGSGFHYGIHGLQGLGVGK
jgi:hypothetical protein